MQTRAKSLLLHLWGQVIIEYMYDEVILPRLFFVPPLIFSLLHTVHVSLRFQLFLGFFLLLRFNPLLSAMRPAAHSCTCCRRTLRGFTGNGFDERKMLLGRLRGRVTSSAGKVANWHSAAVDAVKKGAVFFFFNF